MAELAARGRHAGQLSQRIVQSLPTPLRDHVTFAGLHHDRLLLLVESPAWVTRARMEQARILAAVRSLGLAATSVTTRVLPIQEPGDTQTGATPAPMRADSIRAAAKAIADPGLHALFLELAARAEGRPAE